MLSGYSIFLPFHHDALEVIDLQVGLCAVGWVAGHAERGTAKFHGLARVAKLKNMTRIIYEWIHFR